MAKIFLIGDSVRMGAHGEKGYGDVLKERLQGKAEVYQPEDNCRFAAYTLRYLHEWAEKVPKKDEIDCVLWNNGLWDTLILEGEEGPLTSLPVYVDYMKRVYKRIKYLFPVAKVIFVYSTNVINSLETRESTRSNLQIQEYNRAVGEMLMHYNVPVIDLYSVAETIPLEKRTDWVHYKTEGSEIFADVLYQYLVKKEIV